MGFRAVRSPVQGGGCSERGPAPGGQPLRKPGFLMTSSFFFFFFIALANRFLLAAPEGTPARWNIPMAPRIPQKPRSPLPFPHVTPLFSHTHQTQGANQISFKCC